MSNPQSFEISQANYLGTEYKAYINYMRTMSISKPTDYTILREKVIEKLKKDILNNVYKEYYTLLTTGKGYGLPRAPSYPNQMASSFALSATETINEILDKCLEIVLPAEQEDFARIQQRAKAKVESVDMPTATPNVEV